MSQSQSEQEDNKAAQARQTASRISALARAKADRLQARADRFFSTDEEMPLGPHILLFTIVAFFTVFVLWANLATIDELTRGEGKVIPSSEVQHLQSLEGGIIDTFYVREGQEVKAGQPLVRMRDIQASSDLGVNRKRYLSLEAKVTRLQALANGGGAPQFSQEVMQGAPDSVHQELDAFRASRASEESQLEVLESQRTQREEELRELNSRLHDLRTAVDLTQQQRNVIAPLVTRGSASKVELLQVEGDLTSKQAELNNVNASIPRAASAINEANAKINELKSTDRSQAQSDLAQATAEMGSIRESLAALVDKKARTELVSPMNGVVQAIKIKTVGGVVAPGAEVISIVPLNDQLLVEARVRPSDIAFLHPNQKAVVKITAYDYSIYGGLKGELVDISPDTITDEKGQTFYRVRVKTPQTYIMHKGQKLDIIPGMVARVDIMTGKRTVMEYLLKPLIKTVDEAMRER